MTTPRDIRNFVSDIKSRGFDQITLTDYERLCQLALEHLPQQQERRGKKCPHCSWKIGNACKRCTNCGNDVSKQPVFVRPVDGVNDCKGECASDLTGREYVTLSCGHKFCTGCMQNRIRRGFRTCCLCDRVMIPESIRSKYLPGVV
jgi:CO dehydrogenase/acetyl-CoA synthase alpha subunit